MDTAVLIFIYRSRTEAIIGESDVYPKYGDFSGAWGPKDENTEDYIYIEGGYIFNNFIFIFLLPICFAQSFTRKYITRIGPLGNPTGRSAYVMHCDLRR